MEVLIFAKREEEALHQLQLAQAVDRGQISRKVLPSAFSNVLLALLQTPNAETVLEF
jgi:hypothetical protein